MDEIWETKKQMIRKKVDDLLLVCEQDGINEMCIEIRIEATKCWPSVHYEVDQKIINDEVEERVLRKRLGL